MSMRALLLAFLLAAGAPALAEAPAGDAPPAAVSPTPDLQKATRLNGLFEMLRTASTPDQRHAIEAAIWTEWLKSGDADTDEVMAQALLAMNVGQLQVALRYLDTLVAARPDYAEAWNKRATIYFYLNEYDKSLADIARTLALEPRHFGALSGLGMIRLRLGDKQGALEAFERAYAVDPGLDNMPGVIEQLKEQVGKGI